MDKTWTVYRHIFPNSKSYIGITSKSPEQRWLNGEGYKGQFVYKPIKKYGWNNIKHEILYTNLTLEEANVREKECIKTFNTYAYKKNAKGYNCTLGGDGTCGTPLNDAQKEILSQIHNSNEFKEMLIKRNKEMSKRVFQYSKQGDFLQEWNSYIEASNEYNVSTSSLSWAVKNETLCCDYQWRTFKIINIDEYIDIRLTPVIQFDLKTGKIIYRFNSIKEASYETNINREGISSVCVKKCKSAGGYGWKYDDGNEIILSDYKHNTTGEDVYQFSKQYKLINIFESQRQASEVTEIDYRLINKSVVKHRITNGFIFIKPDDVEILNTIKQKIAIPIHKYDINGNYICSYKHRYWVSKNLGIPLRHIGEGYLSGGFQWVQSVEYQNKISAYSGGNSKPVNQYDKNFNYIATYKSMSEAKKATGATNIMLCVKKKRKSSGGYVWRYTNDCFDIKQKLVC